MKTLRCRDAGFDCDHEVRGRTIEEVLERAAEHAADVHQVDDTPGFAQQVSQLIREEPDRDEAS